MPFYGEDGLYSLFPANIFERESVPPSDIVFPDEITGLLVDVREFSEFQPSVLPRIYSDQGRLLYGPGTVLRSCAVRRGIVKFYVDEEKARAEGGLGFAPFYVFAAGLAGRGKSDVFLDSEDVLRILGSATARRALKNCSVVFLVRPSRRNAL